MKGLFFYLATLFSICAAFSQQYTLKEAFPDLTFDQPVEFVEAPDGSKRIFVIEQKGIIRVFENKPSVKESKSFLDIHDKVVAGGERGLLGLAFHPDFKNNGYFYVNYTTGKPLKTYISRFSVNKTDKSVADSSSEVLLLSFDQPYNNHNGGKVVFGPDGFLYIAVGDGGSANDPRNNGQNVNTLLGKILRIDVNKKQGNLEYAIPADNPFKGKEAHREEIFAYGLRNPWRFSFDKVTGRLWAGDVGQNIREEVDIIVKGGNYGWNKMEGVACFKSETCDTAGLILPIHEYLHSSGDGLSITGGYVYRGKKLKDLFGWYIYGDYVTGKIWQLQVDKSGKVENRLLTKLSGAISSFGEDINGDIYVCCYGEGKIYKIEGK